MASKVASAPLIALVILTNACTGEQGESDSPAPVQNGSMLGYITTYNEVFQFTPKAGVEVSVEGSNPLISAVTDTSGRYEVKNVKAGTYNLIFKRIGYGEMRQFGLAHVGGDLPTYMGRSTMIETVKTRIGIMNQVQPNMATFSCSATIAATSSGGGNIEFTLKKRVGGIKQAIHKVRVGIGPGATLATAPLYYGQITRGLSVPVASRDTLFITCQPHATAIGFYFDPYLGTDIITTPPGLISNEVQFVMP